jgi:hypothetical protein
MCIGSGKELRWIRSTGLVTFGQLTPNISSSFVCLDILRLLGCHFSIFLLYFQANVLCKKNRK